MSQTISHTPNSNPLTRGPREERRRCLAGFIALKVESVADRKVGDSCKIGDRPTFSLALIDE
jgi:hypothetical protein